MEVLEASEQEGARESRGLYWRGGGSAGLVSGFELQELWLGAAWCGVVCSSWRFVEGASEGRHTGRLLLGQPYSTLCELVELDEKTIKQPFSDFAGQEELKTITIGCGAFHGDTVCFSF